ncbi:MAG: sigma-54 dependent transcriptional regulator [Candidatus Krumholzibacteria bacterium]|nr:sigma-54 dependent transcriptional regulator [Candidatus Krumholzibacteria bacterium]
MADIVIVDDEARIGKLLGDELADAGHRTAQFTSPVAALERIGAEPPDILVTDLRMDEMDGITLLKRALQVAPSTDVIVMTAYASLETALETMREGAYDYVIKPFKTEELLVLVARLEERRRLQAENQGLRSYLSGRLDEGMVGNSPAMTHIKQIIQGLAESDAAVLVRGESGTGKELVARAIHTASRRAQGPFIALNCAAIPETLLESELFGYEKGAFTGAARRRMGHFQLAHGGTLFLDEIGDLPLSLQAKLLRVVEDRRVTPLGGERNVEVDLRFISATHRPLEEAIGQGVFREDLYYRLNVFPVALPPLRERREDIRDLAVHFLRGWGRREADLGAGALEHLVAYHWPGNIRELRNVLERATILRPTGTIGRDDILLGEAPSTPSAEGSFPPTLNLAEVEKHVIARALEAARGNKSEAARLLGITRRALYGKLERLGIDG